MGVLFYVFMKHPKLTRFLHWSKAFLLAWLSNFLTCIVDVITLHKNIETLIIFLSFVLLGVHFKKKIVNIISF